jgi:hypothetical protein
MLLMAFLLKYKLELFSFNLLFYPFQQNPNAPPPMSMNVNEGMHNPGVPFFPVRNYLFEKKNVFISILIATGATNDESG